MYLKKIVLQRKKNFCFAQFFLRSRKTNVVGRIRITPLINTAPPLICYNSQFGELAQLVRATES